MTNEWLTLAPRGMVASLLLLASSVLPADALRAAEITGHAAPPASPVSLLDLMRAAVEIPADGIWALEAADKVTDDDWLLADQDAVSLAAAAALVAKPGTGKRDRRWVANADWQTWTRDVQTTALTIRAAAKAKDQTKLSAAADHLAEVCQNCHTKYRPAAPSDGVARYPFYPKRELVK